ncbi:MAG: DUF3800 domain-containing protein [Deltaproteobacteria bacterium]|nr:DUF3800 domain-containing protein [Deltaproteobacteria bacterium]
MYLCYVDESGTPDLSGNSSHYVLVGIAIPISQWKAYDQEVEQLKKPFGLSHVEIHTAWMIRRYFEQGKVTDFDRMDFAQRRSHVEKVRRGELLRLQGQNPKQYQQTKKNFRETADYVHLNEPERLAFITQLAQCIARWTQARLFAECIDKVYFDPVRAGKKVEEQAFEQLVSRFEQFLQIISKSREPEYGLLIHDNNQTVAKAHTELMRKYQNAGTLWTEVNQTIEPPLFVDSRFTSMVQIADLCGYALRRYLEKKEEVLFDLIFQRADRKDGVAVGVRHYAPSSCSCRICQAHRKL